MTEIEVRNGKTVRVGFPMTPSEWVGKPERKPISRVKMTCGGGMGGSVWFEYVDRFLYLDIPMDKMKILTRIDGESICVNPRYMVMVEDFTLVTVKYKTQHPDYKGRILEKQFLVKDGAIINAVNEYDRR